MACRPLALVALHGLPAEWERPAEGGGEKARGGDLLPYTWSRRGRRANPNNTNPSLFGRSEAKGTRCKAAVCVWVARVSAVSNLGLAGKPTSWNGSHSPVPRVPDRKVTLTWGNHLPYSLACSRGWLCRNVTATPFWNSPRYTVYDNVLYRR